MKATGSDLASLVTMGFFTRQALEFVEACVSCRLNVAVCGPEGCGERMMLHALASSMNSDGQILAVQNPDEPWPEHKTVTPLRARLQTNDGGPEISRRYLLSLVPKMHPAGLILDRVEGAEVIPLLQLLLTMDGVFFSVTADSAMDALLKLEELALAHGAEAPPAVIRKVLSTTLHLIIQVGESQSGSATAVRLAEVRETDQDAYSLCDIFVSADDEALTNSPGEAHCTLRPTGARPAFLSRMEALGVFLGDDVFA